MPHPNAPAAASTIDARSLQGATKLADWGLIRARGADAASFLHGQLTQDVAHLDTTHARLAGYCSAKGRLLASFVVWRADTDSLLLACSADLLPATLKRLSMFVLRAKCKFSDAGAELQVVGLAGEAATRWLGDAAPAAVWGRADLGPAQVVRLPDAVVAGAAIARYLYAAPAGQPAPAADDLPPLAPDTWAWLEVQSGVPRIVAATGEQFVPQMVNLELLDGVNFQKGCYPGQEIVARSQYRGTLKRRSFLFEVADGTAAAPGQEVYASDDAAQPAGMVVNAAPSPAGGFTALVELKLTALDAPGLHLGAADGPVLRRIELPYALPLSADAAA